MSEEKKTTKFENRLLILILATVLLFTVVPIVWNHFQRADVLEKGDDATAKIINVTDTGEIFNSKPLIEIELIYSDRSGRETTATVKMALNAVQFASLKPGGEVKIKYDPEDSSKVAIIFGE